MFPRSITYQDQKSFFLFGPRGVGKTAWIRSTFPNAIYFDLLSADTYAQILANPGVVAARVPKGFDDWVILDEVQRVPEVLNEVHRLIELKRTRFILTGSSARKLRHKGVNLLAGRALTKFMHPLTAKELGASFSLNHSLRFGSLPSAYVEQNPAAYLESYVGTYLREEVLQEGLTRNLANFARFLETAAFSQAEVLTMSAVARESMLSPKVVQDYFAILEDLLIAVRVPVFSKAAKRKLITHPKFFFFDCGVFNAIRPRGPLDHPETIPGASVETLFLQQARAVNEYFGLGYRIYYWRSAQQHEVDFVLYGERGIRAFEIKHSLKVRPEDFKSLRVFKSDYPAATACLLYMGSEQYEEDGINVIPLEQAIINLADLL